MTDRPVEPLVGCGSCGAQVLPRSWCAICGQPLEASPSGRRFAAEPSEPTRTVGVVSTLFPRLPRADMGVFRTALVIGLAALVGLVALGYLAIALAASAFLVPLLLAVYLYSADVYEDEPIRVLLVTYIWGALAGAAFGLLLRGLFPARVLPGPDDVQALLVRVVLLPGLAVLLMVVGPLAMLLARRFDDVLDGATFGAISGATFVGTQVIVQSIDLLTAGPQPGGATWSWIMRIVEQGFCIPIVAGAAAAGVCGAAWLRYRSPVTDRQALGPLGRPVVAFALAIGAMVAASASLVLMRELERLAALLLLTAASLVWLRQLIDLGLRQEAAEAATVEMQPCIDCGRETPGGSFCVHCGVALRALPKRSADPSVPGGTPRRAQPARLPGPKALLAFVVAFVVVIIVAAGAVVALSPSTSPACPDPLRPCAAIASSVQRAVPGAPAQERPGVMRFGQTWPDERGWELDYDPRTWAADDSDPSGALWLTSTFVAQTTRGDIAAIPISLRIEVVPVEEQTPDTMLAHLGTVTDGLLESVVDQDEHATRLLRPHVGFRPATSRYLVGDVGAFGAMTPLGAHLLAASDGRLTAGLILFLPRPDESFPFHAGSVRTTRYVGDLLDDIVKRFYWTEAQVGPPPVAGQAQGVREDGARGMMPEELRRAYGIDQLHAAGLRGQGQVVAVMSFDTFLDSDLAAWDRLTGTVGGAVERFSVGAPIPLGPGSGEVDLDIQMIRAIAPEATIIDFEGEWGDTPYANVVEAILLDGRADIASLSWGHCEAWADAFPERRAWFESMIDAEDATFRRAFEAGLTIFSIPGDEGAYGCVRLVPEAFHHLLATWYPGSHPLVVSVGGTYQWRREDGSYHREATWVGPMSGEASGGGPSRFFPMPDWQRTLGLEGRSPMRLSPDVAGPGDPDSGLYILSTPVTLLGDTWVPVAYCPDGSTPPCPSFGGGTSQSAPFWAGVMALIRQGAEQEGLLPLIDGRAHLPPMLPLLYRIAADRPEAFHDVTEGSNLLEDATPGWDPATGLGSPDVPALAAAVWDALRAAPDRPADGGG